MHALHSISGRIWLAFLVVIWSADTDENVDEIHQRAVQRLADGRFAQALTLLDEVIRRNPANAKAYRCRAFGHLLQGDPESAIADFSQAIRIDPLDAVLFYGRGSAYRLLPKDQEAFHDFTEAVRLDPEYAAAYFGRAKVRDELDVLGAIADAGRAFQFGCSGAVPSGIEEKGTTRVGPAALYAELETGSRVNLEVFLIYSCWELIYERYSASSSLAGGPVIENSTDAEAYKKLALRCATKRLIDKSIGALDEAIKLAPHDGDAYKLRGVVRVTKGDLKGAIADFTKAIDLNPADIESYVYRASACCDAGDVRTSVHDWEKILRLNKRQLEKQQREWKPR